MGSEKAGFKGALLTGLAVTSILTGITGITGITGLGCGGGDDTGSGAESEMMGAAASSPTAGAGPSAPTQETATAGAGAKTSTPSSSGVKPAGDTTPATTTTSAATTSTPAASGGAGTTAAMAMMDAMAGAAGSMDSSAAAGAADMGAAGAPADMSMSTDMGTPFAIRGDDPTDESANGRNKGPYSVESYTNGYKQGDFSDATMWYPSSPEAEPPFGCVAVVPGFVSPQASIRNWGPFLASYGIVAITIGVPGSDVPQQRAMSLLSALETCKGENSRADSPIKGKLDESVLGVAGWSMGGGGTLIAAAGNPMLKAAVSFAAWGPSGGDMNKVPVLMFEATADPLAASMSDGYYQAVPDSTPKMLFEVQGAGHDVANDPANSQGIIGKYGLAWFKVYLEGDMRYKKFLTAPPPNIVTMKFKTNVK